MDNHFLGIGWNFPVALDEGKQIKLAREEESIRQSIWMILDTSPGERVMRPDFGCGMHDQVFGVNDASTANAIGDAVREALGTWEPRIDVLDVYANPDPANPNVLLIEINYQVRATNSRYNLVYPFYLE
jgi:uncharacterized protein